MSSTRSLKRSAAGFALPSAESRRGAIAVLGLLVAAAAVVTARRLAGALQVPLDSANLLTAAALTAAAGAIVRLGWFLPRDDKRIGRLDLAVMAATSVAVAALCSGACSPRNTPLEAELLPWAIIVIEEGLAWLWLLVRGEKNSRSPAGTSPRLPEEKTPDPFIITPEVTQQLVRSVVAGGAEELRGRLRLSFAPRQRTGSVHIALCPPLSVTPEVQVEQIEGPQARIKTAQLLPYGIRFDLKLAAASESPTAVLLQFTARTPPEG